MKQPNLRSYALVLVLLSGALSAIAGRSAFAQTGAAGAAASRLDVGGEHSCAVRTNGVLSCWGRNNRGQLGIGSSRASTVPVAVPLPNVKAVATGSLHTCALLNDGHVVCWGDNSKGQLGNGESTGSLNAPSAPVSLPGPGTAIAISAGGDYSCAILIDKTTTCWGSDAYGQLGNGSAGDQLVPTAVISLPGDVVSISAGFSAACAVLSDGRVFCWGETLLSAGSRLDQSPVNISLPSVATSVSAGVNSCAVLVTQQVACWGFNFNGELGRGLPAPASSDLYDVTAKLITAPASWKFVSVNAGSATCGVIEASPTTNASVVCWGSLTDANIARGSLPTFFSVPGTAVAVATGAHICAMFNDERVSCVGSDQFGQIGNGIENGYGWTPRDPISTVRFNKISIGYSDMCGISSSFTSPPRLVSCWGARGPGSFPVVDPPGATLVSGGQSVSVGLTRSCAISRVLVGLRLTDSVKCWTVGTPVTVLSANASPFSAVSGQCSLLAENNSSGGPVRCSAPYSDPGMSPSPIVTMPDGLQATSIAGLGAQQCAVLTDASVACWGLKNLEPVVNSFPIATQGPPERVVLPSPGTAKVVAAGGKVSCAILTDDRLACWGDNTYGQLGRGTTSFFEQTPMIVPLPGPGTAKAVSVADGHLCAVLTDGSLACWGNGSSGVLGIGEAEGSFPTPSIVALPSGTTAIDVSTGAVTTCAVLSDNALSCWGSDDSGLLGDGPANWAMQPSPSAPFVLPVAVDVPTSTTTPATTTTTPVTTTTTPVTTTTKKVPVFPPLVLPEFVPFVPIRLADTRSGGTTVDGLAQASGRRAAGSVMELQIGGRGGVPGDARAVALNVTVTDAGAAPGGYVSVYPCGGVRPNVSTLNYKPGATVANSLVIAPSADGKICVYTFTDAQVIVDVTGYMPASAQYQSVSPGRLLDTRNSPTIDGLFSNGGVRSAGSVLELQVGGRGGVPLGAKAAALNVTATDTGGEGFVTVFPCDVAQPNASALNYPASSTVANSVVASLSAAGKVCLSVSANTHLIVDVNGFFPSSSSFASVGPSRLVDTRSPGVDGGIRAAETVLTIQVAGRAEVPSTATAAVLNVTATGSSSDGGYLTVFPCDGPRPNTSSVNYGAGQTVAGNVITKLSTTGTVCVYNFTGTHVLVDVTATFA